MHTVSCSFAVPPLKSSVNSLVKIDLLEVSPLSRRMLFQSLSILITRSAFAFSSVPYPRFHRPSLRSAFRRTEKERAYHVSRNKTMQVRCRLSAGSHVCPCIPTLQRNIRLHTFWFRLISNFSLFPLNGVYQRFTLHSPYCISQAPQPDIASSLSLPPHGFRLTLSGGLPFLVMLPHSRYQLLR